MKKDGKLLKGMFLVIVLLTGILIASSTTTAAEYNPVFTDGEEEIDFYDSLSDDLELIEIYDCNELTLNMLLNRNGKIIIEKCIGVVSDAATGSGEILNAAEGQGWYICYDDVKGIRDGSVICTYFIYNPDTNYEDDIIARFDYIIDTEYED